MRQRKNESEPETVLIKQGGDNQGNQGNHEKIRDLYNSGKIMEKSGNFLKISPNHGTLHFCLLNVAKTSPNRRYQKRKQEEKEMKQNLKIKKRLKLS